MIRIRKAKVEEAKDISSLNVEIWCTTYKGIISDEYLEKRVDSVLENAERIKKEIENDNDVYVCLTDNKIVGMMILGKSRNNDYLDSGEFMLYMLKMIIKKWELGSL